MKNLINGFFRAIKILILSICLFVFLISSYNLIKYKKNNMNTIIKIDTQFPGKLICLKKGFVFSSGKTSEYVSLANILKNKFPMAKKKNKKRRKSFFS